MTVTKWILSVGGTHFTNRDTNETISATRLVAQLETANKKLLNALKQALTDTRSPSTRIKFETIYKMEQAILHAEEQA